MPPDKLTEGLVRDCELLLAARDALAGEGIELDWGYYTDIERWEGVGLGGTPLRVRAIHLPYRGLAGVIPPELGGLTQLRRLNLVNNVQLSGGSIPPELGNLRELRFLNLGGNQLHGTIPPELGNLRELRFLNLGGNHLSGAIPPELGNLPELWLLHLGRNQLTGEIPPELGNLAQLEELELHFNRFSGTIPPELTNLGHLKVLFLTGDETSYTGCVPPALYDLAVTLLPANMPCADQELALAPPAPPTPPLPAPAPTPAPPVALIEMARAGIPTCLDSTGLPNVWSNAGLLQDCFALMSIREPLAGAGKELHWEHSVDIDQWPGVSLGGEPARVTRLRLEGMDLAGQAPPELAQLDALRELNLSGNRLSGSIPYELGDLSELEYLNLGGNELTGIIPPELGKLRQLKVLDLGNNQLSEEIPPRLGSLTNLEMLSLRNNRLSGDIPSRLGNLQKLKRVRLDGGNSFTGGCLPAEWEQVSPDFLAVLELPYCLDPSASKPETGPIIGYPPQPGHPPYVPPTTIGEMLAELNQRVNTTTLPNLPEDAHNIFLQAGLQTGVAGIIVVALLCGSLLFNLARRDGGKIGPVECFAAAGTLMIVLHSNFEVFLFQSVYIVVWVFIGLGAGFAYTRRQESAAAPELQELPAAAA